MALGIVGCSLLPGRQVPFTFAADQGRAALPGVLVDRTGSVVDIVEVVNLDPAPPIDRGMMTLADATEVVVHWLGGACDERVTVDVGPEGSLTITVTTTIRPVACDGVAIPRTVLIRFTVPLDPMRTTVYFEP